MSGNLEEKKRAVRLLESGTVNITAFDKIFIAYSTRFLGTSTTAEYIIDGENTKNAIPLDEFCYGYDGIYHQLQLMSVYKMANEKKFATAEIVNGVYAFWEIVEH